MLEHTRELVTRGKEAQAGLADRVRRTGPPEHPDQQALYDRMQTRTLPDGWADDLPVFDADPKGVATRKACGR